MNRIPDVLDPSSLPVAERSALQRDGVLFPLAGSLIVVDVLDSPRLRAEAVLGIRSRRLIAELDTAAWIWGAINTPPDPPELCAVVTARARLDSTATGRAREVVLHPDDIASFGGVQVTSPLRTAVDLARLRGEADYEPEVARHLAGDRGRQRALALLDERRLPGTARARSRITSW